MSNTSYLLNSVYKTRKNYLKEYSRSGVLFNLFSITNIERKEVNTHSAMIAELLNPEGSHHQGLLFLNIFFQSIEYIKDKNIDFQSAKVTKEKSFNHGKDRVDIIIEFSNFTLIIENKIDASDQKLQLRRYHDIAKDLNKDFIIIYLTKYGYEATKESHDGVEYETISYKENIVNWLELSIKEVALIPQIRETLLQYIYLIKKITGESLTMNESQEIIQDIKNNMSSATSILRHYKKAQAEIVYDFFQYIQIKFHDKLIFKNELSEKSQKNFLLNNENKLDKKMITNWVEKNGKKETWEVKLLLFKVETQGKITKSFFIMLATDWFHYGYINLTNDENGKLNYVQNKHSYENKQFEGFIFRDWAFAVFYSSSKEFRKIDDNVLEFISNPKSFSRIIEENI